LIREGCRALQLLFKGENLFEPVRLLTDALVEPRRLRARLDGIECLNTISAGKSFPNRLFPRDPMARRLRQVLQALDGWLAGASYRDIAIALFGETRVAADWGDPRKYLFDQVRRAVRRGRTLMDGGYRDLLL
jgi:hypothetical protein